MTMTEFERWLQSPEGQAAMHHENEMARRKAEFDLDADLEPPVRGRDMVLVGLGALAMALPVIAIFAALTGGAA